MKNKIVIFVIALTIGLTFSACSPQQVQYPSLPANTDEPAYTPTDSRIVGPSNTLQATATIQAATATGRVLSP